MGNQGRRAVITLLDIGDGSHIELFEPLPGTQTLSGDADRGHVVFHFALQTTDIARRRSKSVRAAGMEIRTELTSANLGTLNVTIAFLMLDPAAKWSNSFKVND